MKMNAFIYNTKQTLLLAQNLLSTSIRWASKKTGGSTRNAKGSGIKKHRGWKKNEGCWVEPGTILVLQRHLRFHPGLNVGMGRNGTLFARIPGHVMITCEKADLNWEHTWVQRCYAGREHTTFYKKYFNVIPNKQHQNFVLKDQV